MSIKKKQYLQAFETKLVEGEALFNTATKREEYNEWLNSIKPILANYLGEDNGTYKNFWTHATISHSGMTEKDYFNRAKQRHKTRLQTLKGIIETIKIELSCEPPALSEALEIVADKSKVFIVHGHDEIIKTKVESLLTRLGLEPIVLHKQADLGQTVIEKFTKHSEVSYAIVIATGDDLGRSKMDKPDMEKPRARQNVILELGYFTGKLGRGNVRLLYEKGVDLPSDFAGVLFEPLETTDAWEFKLAREMRAAGLPVDMNKI